MVFADFVVPDPLVAGALLAATLVVALVLYAVRPKVTQATVLALVPWMVSGALLHVLYQMHRALDDGLLPSGAAELLSAPSVYATTFVLMGLVWIPAVMFVPRADRYDRAARNLGAMGALVVVAVGTVAVWTALDESFAPNPVLPVFGLLAALLLTAVVYLAIGAWRGYVVDEARLVGALVLFAHAFDALTTAIGVEVLGVGERSEIPRRVMAFAADLPTADALGEAWLFVVLKMVVASALVVLFSEYLVEEPAEGNLFFALIAAVGLGPGVHNFALFALGVGV